jgi:hypothetical protein
MVNLVSGATPPQRAGLGNEEKLTLNFIPRSVRKYKRTIIADFEQKGQQPPAQEFKLNMIPGANVSSSPRCRSLGKNCSSLAILSKDKQQKMLLMHGEQQPLIQVKISSRVVHRLKTAKAPVSAVREIRKREKRLASTKDLRWERTRRVTLRTKLFYVSTKDGNAAPEESSPLINELNEKLNGPQAALLFGALPFSIADQQAMGTDETTGQAVPVRTNGPAQSDAEASAILTHTAGNNWDLNVTFPKANPEHLYSVMYHARVVDNFGNDGEIDQQVWNHELKIHKTTDVAGMIDQLLQIAGTDPGSIRKDANISGLPPEFWGVASAKQRRAGMVLQRAGEIVQTMDVALFDDIEKLLNLVQLYSGT